MEYESLCVTTLLNDQKGPVWSRRDLKAAPWSRVLATTHFEAFRERADLIFSGMEGAKVYCPMVTLFKGSVRIAFTIEDRVAVYLLDPGMTRFGMGKVGEPYDLSGVPIDAEIIQTLGLWVAKGVAE